MDRYVDRYIDTWSHPLSQKSSKLITRGLSVTNDGAVAPGRAVPE